MSMSFEEFLNYCESINSSYIDWIIEPVQSKQNWPISGSGINKGIIVIEEFLFRTEELFDSEQFKTHANEKGCKLLLKLHHLIDEYFSNPNTMLNLMSRENLIHDERWSEIQQLGEKVKLSLELFIKQGRSNV